LLTLSDKRLCHSQPGPFDGGFIVSVSLAKFATQALQSLDDGPDPSAISRFSQDVDFDLLAFTRLLVFSFGGRINCKQTE
jgi:hypothetical protein